MIHDGYTLTARLGEATIVYRPMLAAERNWLFQAGLTASETAARRLLSDQIRQHVLFTDAEILPENELVFERAFWAVSGLRDATGEEIGPESERKQAENLRDGVWLELTHPNVAHRDCGHCLEFLYNEDRGGILATKGNGNPIRRPPGVLAPCRTVKGCPKGTPEASRSLSEANRQAFRHYLGCRATGRFPDDAIVRRNARIIESQLQALTKAAPATVERMTGPRHWPGTA